MIDAGVARAAQIVDVYELADHRAEFLTHEYPVRELGEVVQQIANQPGTRVYLEDVGGWPVRLTIVRDKLVPDISSMGRPQPAKEAHDTFGLADAARNFHPFMRGGTASTFTTSVNFPYFRSTNTN